MVDPGFGKSWVLLFCQVAFVKLVTDGIVAHSFTRERLPGSTLFICLIATKYFYHKNLKGKNWTTKPFLKMDNKIQIERLRYAQICGERTLFHDLKVQSCKLKKH